MIRNRRKKFLIVFIILIVVVTLMVYSILPSSLINRGTTPLSFIARPIENLVTGVLGTAQNYFETASLNRDLSRENDRLRKDNVALRLQVKENEAAALEYEKLKDIYNLSSRFDYASFVAARITQGPLNRDLALYRIDQGTDAGIDLNSRPGYPVINAQGQVFGRIYNADARSAKVLPLISEGFSVSCYVEENRGQTFILKADSDKQKDQLCLIEEIPPAAALKEGDKIITSGLGGIFPYGLELGQVEKLLPVDSKGFRRALVKPSLNFAETDIVFVLTADRLKKEQAVQTEPTRPLQPGSTR